MISRFYVIFQDLFGVLEVFSNKKAKIRFFCSKNMNFIFSVTSKTSANRSPIVEGDLFSAFKNNTIVNNASSASNEKIKKHWALHGFLLWPNASSFFYFYSFSLIVLI